MGSAHHSLREHPIVFAFGEEVQIPLISIYIQKRKDTLLDVFSLLASCTDLDILKNKYKGAVHT